MVYAYWFFLILYIICPLWLYGKAALSSCLLEMEDRIILIATLRLLDNRLSELKAAVQELQKHCVKTEQGMLQYDWYLSENSDIIKVFETYVNSEAVLFHFDNYKPFAPALSESRTFVSLEVFGNANEALRQRVQKINAPHFKAISNFNTLK